MKKITTLLIFTLAVTTGFAQESNFREEFSKFMDTGWGTKKSGFSADNFTAIIMHSLNEMQDCPYKTNTEKSQAASRLAQKYYSEQSMEDFKDILIPCYQKHMTADELKEINNLLSEDKRLFTAGNKLVSNDIIQAMTDALGEQIISTMTDIIGGKEAKPMLTKKEMQSDLYLAIKEYCEASGLSSTTINTFSGRLSAMAQDEQQKAIMEKVIKHVFNEIPAAYYKGCKGNIAVEDIQYVTSFFKSPLGTKIVAGSTDAIKDPMELATKLIEKMEEWLNKQEL